MIKKLSYYSVIIRDPVTCHLPAKLAGKLYRRGIRAITIYGENLNSKEVSILDSLIVRVRTVKGLENVPLRGRVPSDIACDALVNWDISLGLDAAMEMMATAIWPYIRDSYPRPSRKKVAAKKAA